MKLALNFPPLEPAGPNAPETRPPKLATWLERAMDRDAVQAARLIGDALAATNRIDVADSRRLELATLYWNAAGTLWPGVSREFAKASQPLAGDALDAARVAIDLSTELAHAYKRLLANEANKRIALGGQRLLIALIRQALRASTRVLTNSYTAYAPVPAQTWHDVHAIYAFARARNIHQATTGAETEWTTPETIYVRALLLALANPYGFLPGQLDAVIRYIDGHAQAARLTDVAPVHRMAKAVAIVPVGHDFPPFSASKGGSVEGAKFYLLTFDLAFALQEEVRALETGGEPPPGFHRGVANRSRNLAILRRLLRQWAIPPARQFSRLPSRGRVVASAGFLNAWHVSRGKDPAATKGHPDLPAPTTCRILNQTPHGYALRQAAASPAPLRINDLIALRSEGRQSPQIAIVRWFRNTMNGTALEFGCELVADGAEAGTAAPEGTPGVAPTPVVVLTSDRSEGREDAPDQVAVPAGAFGLEHAVGLWRGSTHQMAVLTNLTDQGSDYDIYEYVTVT